MQVAGQCLWVNIEQTLKMVDLRFIVFQGLEILQVADMLTEEGMFALAETTLADGEYDAAVHYKQTQVLKLLFR